MVSFDFITDDNFRASLEADYHELELCMNVGAWKAVHVLAGSIVETLLLDYLIATEYDKRSSRKLRSISLEEIIDICKCENVLTNKSADLSNAIREYRNLIHPERIKRLGEKVDENGAVVAQALVKMVIEGVAARRSEKMGLTAEQLVTKIEQDHSKAYILEHLLKTISDNEKKRFLLKVLPKRYLDLKDTENHTNSSGKNPTHIALGLSFRLAFDNASIETKESVIKEFVRVLKDEPTRVVAIYEEIFFRGQDLAYFSPEDSEIVKHHLLSKLHNNISSELVKATQGIGPYLNKREISLFVDALIRGMVYEMDINVENTKKIFLNEFTKMRNDSQDATVERINDWLQTFKQSEYEFGLNVVQDLIAKTEAHIAARSFLPDFPDDVIGDI